MRIVDTGDYNMGDLGVVHIVPRKNARNITVRWKGGMMNVSCPLGISYDSLLSTLRNMHPRLMAHKPAPLYHIGQRIELPEFSIEIIRQSHAPDKMILTLHQEQAFIQVGTNWDLSSPSTIKQISKFMCRIAQSRAKDILLPRARTISQEIGRTPLMWTINNGHRVLGHCSQNGIIALSYILVFYPPHLRDFVIKHELAHLSEMNHSPKFHEICNQYCNNCEAELIAELKAYKIPVIK